MSPDFLSCIHLYAVLYTLAGEHLIGGKYVLLHALHPYAQVQATQLRGEAATHTGPDRQDGDISLVVSVEGRHDVGKKLNEGYRSSEEEGRVRRRWKGKERREEERRREEWRKDLKELPVQIP